MHPMPPPPENNTAANSPASSPLIVADNISAYRRGFAVVRDVSLQVERGDFTTIVGPNGAGKTTLLKCLLGLSPTDSGTVRRAEGIKIGYAPQNFFADYVFPLTASAFLSLRNRASAADIADIAAETDIESALPKPLHLLSGGELQRVLIARALLRRPDVLALDEPAQNLDIGGQTALYQLLSRLYERRRMSILMVSHDLHMVMAATKKVVCMYHHICCSGEPHHVAQHPEFVALLGDDMAKMTAVYHHTHDHRHDND